MARKHFKLPDLGEGLTEGEILQWFVKVGDTVTLNQPIVEVETAKAAVEVPSPFAGVVQTIHHEAGATVDVGAVIITFETEPGAATAGDPGNPEEATAAAFAPEEGALIGEVGPGGRTATLVGYGPKSGPACRRGRSRRTGASPSCDRRPRLGRRCRSGSRTPGGRDGPGEAARAQAGEGAGGGPGLRPRHG
jgi:2-oxoisovalerate dehydrogenase E2 component (dihydrolipoyl transacylase)